MSTRCVTSSWVSAFAALALLAAGMAAQAQNCPPVDLEDQKARQQQCRVSGGEWARFGIHNHLCGIYTCAERTKDAGKPCTGRLDCEYVCITKAPAARIGAEATGQCAAVKTTFGCFTFVEGGKVVGRICAD